MKHITVLLKEAIEAMNIKPDGTYIDCTLGLGGHSYEIAKRLDGGRLVSIDRDKRAIEMSRENLAAFGDKVTLVHGEFSNIKAIMESVGLEKADSILADFGISSPQVDMPERGFSYRSDIPENAESPLDMRMDETAELTAYTIVNTWDEQSLKKILYEYGDEKYGARIAAEIVKHREVEEIKTNGQLEAIIRRAMPGAALREPQHPCKRSYQALRTAVNNEMGEIDSLFAEAPGLLNKGGRFVCISFQSHEDRRVKTAFKKTSDGCTCPKSMPACVCGFEPSLKIITKKPIVPTVEEVRQNPRSRSAKMRVAERI